MDPKELKSFLESLKYSLNYSEHTVTSYRTDILLFYDFIGNENFTILEVSPQLIRNFLTSELRRSISKRTIKRRMASLRHFFSYLLENKYLQVNPFELVSSPKFTSKLPDFLTSTEIDNLFSHNLQRTDFLMLRDQAIIELMYATGLRSSEVVNLTFQQLDIKNRIMKIIGKGNKERVVPLSKSAKLSLEKYLTDFRPKLEGKKGHPKNSFVFLNYLGDPLTTSGLESILKSIEKKTGVFLKLHPHKFRHSFATEMLNLGADLRTIQEILGHESLGTTQVYTHVTYKSMRESYFNNFPRAHKNHVK